MTKDEAILLALANTRGLVTLTAIEAAEVDKSLAYAANDLRHALAATKVAVLQQRVASADPAKPYGLSGDIADLKTALDHQREVGEMAKSDRDLPARVRAREGCARTAGPTSNPLIGLFLASSGPSVS